MEVGYVYDELMTLHYNPFDITHPECPERVVAIYNRLRDNGLLDKMVHIKSREASVEELYLAHDPKYVTELQSIIESHDTE